MSKVTVNIPEGDSCMVGTKPCIFARYTKRMCGYNCQIHNKILKGGESPRKCDECKERCRAQAEGQNGDEI